MESIEKQAEDYKWIDNFYPFDYNHETQSLELMSKERIEREVRGRYCGWDLKLVKKFKGGNKEKIFCNYYIEVWIRSKF